MFPPFPFRSFHLIRPYNNFAKCTCFCIHRIFSYIYRFVCPRQLQDYGKAPSGETEVQFRLTRTTLEPMLKSMAYISQQLSTPANKVAVINLKVFSGGFGRYFYLSKYYMKQGYYFSDLLFNLIDLSYSIFFYNWVFRS